MRKIFLLFNMLVLPIIVCAQNGHDITIKIKNYLGHQLILTSYYGDKIRLVDTAEASNPGVFVFRGSKVYPGGIYMVLGKRKNKLFEFVMDKQQHFSLQTDTVNYSLNMDVKNSLDNDLFFQYMAFNEQQYSSTLPILNNRKKFKKGSPDYRKYTLKLDSLKEVMNHYRDRLVVENPNTYVAQIIRAMSEEEKLGLEKPASKEEFYQLKKHYWDHFSLNNPSLFRTPLYDKKVSNYLKYFVPQQPDSVIRTIDNLISKARNCDECISYLVWKFTMDYQNPKYMGFDKVFVHLVDQYFEKEPIQNTTPSVLQLLKKRANVLRPLLLGNKAPELILVDTMGQYRPFATLPNKFTLLLFWDYHCGVCKQEIKKLIPLYDTLKNKYDLEVYAININPDLKNWKKAVLERKLPWINVNGTRSIKGDYTKTYDINGTPQFYLLDQQKRIIAKQFSVDQLKLILENAPKINK